MSFELAPGTLLNNRYQIKKVIAFAEEGGVYQARDLKVTDREWIIKEIIPSPSLDDETLAERKALFLEAVESITQFEHPGLSRILDHFTEAKREYVVMERVEGVTLQTLCDMSVNPLPERQILGWSLHICDALSYLHNRPKPFIFHALTPGHIILTSDEKVSLINYGLDRFFAATAPPKVFTDSPADILKEFARFGETMCFLLTKEKAGPYGLPAGANVSPELTRIINRCLQGESQKTYTSFEDLKKNLEQVLNPPEAPKKVEEAPVARGRQTLPPEWVERALLLVDKFLAQRRAFIVAEALVLIAAIAGLWTYTHPSYGAWPGKPAGGIGFVACTDNDLLAIRLVTRTVMGRKALESAPADLVADEEGAWLYVSERQLNRIRRIDISTFESPERNPNIAVDKSPGRMALDNTRKELYVVHETTNNVSRVSLSQSPPRMEGIMAVGNGPREVVVSEDGRHIFVSNFKANSISVIEPASNKTLATVEVPGGPGALALTPDGKQLWVACENADVLRVVDLTPLAPPEEEATPSDEEPSPQPTEKPQRDVVLDTDLIDEIGGRKPVSLAFSPDGSKAYVVNNGSNNISVLDVTTRKILRSITTPPGPQRLIRLPADTSRLWLTSSGKTAITVIDMQSDRSSGEIEVGCKVLAETVTR